MKLSIPNSAIVLVPATVLLLINLLLFLAVSGAVDYVSPCNFCYDSSMFNNRNLAIFAIIIALTACASPDVDTTAPTFDKTQYTADLDTCRGGTALKVTLDGLVGAVYGSAIGAAEGAFHGAIAGDAPEGAFIVQDCLRGKGYLLDS